MNDLTHSNPDFMEKVTSMVRDEVSHEFQRERDIDALTLQYRLSTSYVDLIDAMDASDEVERNDLLTLAQTACDTELTGQDKRTREIAVSIWHGVLATLDCEVVSQIAKDIAIATIEHCIRSQVNAVFESKTYQLGKQLSSIIEKYHHDVAVQEYEKSHDL